MIFIYYNNSNCWSMRYKSIEILKPKFYEYDNPKNLFQPMPWHQLNGATLMEYSA